ncbi:hypothetical protein C9374_004189 [Naegleria lovaniensis]|uniref:Oxidoreductase n=1 Tax=Naegleria lovaniensis TaxID=51637 RepID=A0AA88GSU1_NAELO|nr:uncharacterized protein C9374_004189 [Naegleria lovaniensis]KAG2383518.1 hypothetical protein C9374_004189 [Naegleria lovaniensis]
MYRIFKRLRLDDLDEIRIEYLNRNGNYNNVNNHDVDNSEWSIEARKIGSRLIELFSRGSSRNMWTYDEYFKHHSLYTWPSSCFRKGRTYTSTVNENNNDNNVPLIRIKLARIKKPSPVEEDYRFYPNEDTYEITFGEFVKRKVKKREYLGNGFRNYKTTTKQMIIGEEESQDMENHRLVYADKISSFNNSYNIYRSKYCENVVRLYEKPDIATIYSFQNRLSDILKCNPVIETLLDCIFEYNRTTSTRNSDSVIMKDLRKVLLNFEKLARQRNLAYNILKTNGTLNICVPSVEKPRLSSYPPRPIPDAQLMAQFVLRKIETIEEIMCFFDMDCCRFCYDGRTVFTILEGLRALKYKINFVSKEHIEKGLYYNRACKFGKRGFHTLFISLHPLFHVIHADYMVQDLKQDIFERQESGENDHVDNIWSGFFNPASGKYFAREHRDIDNTKDLDEANYYTVVLRSLTYELVDAVLENGLKDAFTAYSSYYVDGRWTAEEHGNALSETLADRIIHHITTEDIHIFCSRFSELFMKDASSYFLEGYFESHLRNKYNIYKCYICGMYSHHYHDISLQADRIYGSSLPKREKRLKEIEEKFGMCNICKKFHEQKSIQSMAFKVKDLSSKVAIVTGGRIKIGFETALMLLRCNATVIVTTRFIEDALERFKAELDYSTWQHALILYPLNLKDGKSVLQFTDFVLKHFSRVDILINNAAQTVKRPLNYYEKLFRLETTKNNSLTHCTHNKVNEFMVGLTENIVEFKACQDFISTGKVDKWGEQCDERWLNSWNQKLFEISNIELIEAQMINNVAPTILVSKLFDCMKYSPDTIELNQNDKFDENDSVSMGHTFIINVTSHEGQFTTEGKTDNHIQTNISKASLNMMTRSAANFFAKHGILMNSVDTGWISSALPETFKTPPLSPKDGALRILDTILTGSFAYGKLFKNYQETEW